MAYPGGRALHFDAALSNFGMSAWNDKQDFIAELLFPEITVDKESDRYLVIDPGAFLRAYDTARARGTVAKPVDFSVSSDAYVVDNRALIHNIPLEDIHNADAAMRRRENGVILLTGALKLDQEIKVANVVTCGTNNGSYVVLSGANKWSATGSANIIAQVQTARATMRMQTGLLPNTVMIDWESWELAKQNVALKAALQYTIGAAIPDEVLAAQVFGLPMSRIFIGKAIMNTAAERVDSDPLTSGSVWGGNCWFGHVNPQNGFQTVTYGVRFRWKPPIYPANLAVQRAQYGEAGQAKVEVLECGYYGTEKVTAPQLGYLLSGTR